MNDLDYDSNSVQCPKCGQKSDNPEICSVCGAVFSKVREREYGREYYEPIRSSGEPTSESGRSLGRPLFLLLLFLTIVAASIVSIWFWQQMQPRTIESLIDSHRELVKRARNVIADEIEGQKQLPEHKKLYLKTLDLGSMITKMSENKELSEESKFRLDTLSDANSRLAELLSMSTEEFIALAAKMNYGDPFSEVDEKINIAQNPELARKGMNPLFNVLQLLQGKKKNEGK